MSAPKIVTGAPVCPACERARAVDAEECPYCGVIYRMYRPRLPPTALQEVADEPAPSRSTVHLSLGDRARLFETAAQALEAGLAIKQYLDGPALDAYVPAVKTILKAGFEDTQKLSTTLEQAGLIDTGSAAILVAGETQGKLPGALRALATRYRASLQARRRLLLATAYPAFLIVASAVIMPLPKIVTAGVGAYLSTALPPILFVATVYVLGLVVLPRLDPRATRWLRSIAAVVPPFSVVAKRRAVAAFAETLSDGVEAGLPILLAIQLAFDASGHPHLESRVGEVIEAIEGGRGLAEALEGLGFFAPADLATVAHGELVGRLDEVLPRIAEEHRRRARALTLTMIVVSSAIVLGLVVVAIAWAVIDGFTSYVDSIDHSIEGILNP